MTVVVIVAGLARVVAAVYFGLRAGADRSADMGAVSHQWIAEHRLGTIEDPRR